MKGLRTAAASAAVLIISGAGGAYAADLNVMPVKALPAPGPTTCTSIADFFTTACQVAGYGIRFYGTIDVGVNYSTNGAKFDRLANIAFFPGRGSMGAKWLPGFNALSPSNVGLQVKEPLGAGWSFVGQLEAAWLPPSGQLLNGVHSVYTQVNKPLGQVTAAADSNSQGQFYNNLGFAGFSNDTWGTITFGRQNSLGQDLYLAYDPMGAAPGFGVPGFFGGYAGQGDTENRKDTTSVKYRVNVADWHFGAYGQFGGYDEGNASKGAVEGNIGTDFKVGPGVFSADVVGAYRRSAVAVGLTGATDNFTGLGVATANTQTMTATVSDNTSVIVAARYEVDRLKLFAGYEWTQFANPSDTYSATLHTGFTDIAGDFVCAGCNGVNFTNISTTAFNGGKKIQQFAFTGARYALTGSLDVTGAYYHVWQNDYSGGVQNPVSHFGCAQVSTIQGSCAGALDAVSVLIDWKFAPKWDTYIGTLYSRLSGGMDSGFLVKDNLSTTLGLRFRW